MSTLAATSAYCQKGFTTPAERAGICAILPTRGRAWSPLCPVRLRGFLRVEVYVNPIMSEVVSSSQSILLRDLDRTRTHIEHLLHCLELSSRLPCTLISKQPESTLYSDVVVRELSLLASSSRPRYCCEPTSPQVTTRSSRSAGSGWRPRMDDSIPHSKSFRPSYTGAPKVLMRDGKGSLNRSSSHTSWARPTAPSAPVPLCLQWDTYINSGILFVQIICPFRLDSHSVPGPKSPGPSLSRT